MHEQRSDDMTCIVLLASIRTVDWRAVHLVCVYIYTVNLYHLYKRTRCLSYNSMGPTSTPTRTLGMRLSCNFVNVYTIAYRVQHTFTRVHARIPNGQPREDPREDTRACRSSRRKVGEDCRACPARDKRTRRLPREDPRAEVGEDVGVGVGVGPMEFKLLQLAATCEIDRSRNICTCYNMQQLFETVFPSFRWANNEY